MVVQERLKELLNYNPETGIFIRRVATGPHGRNQAGKVVGGLDRHGHIRISVDDKKYAAHRLAWLYMTGDWPSKEIDHINRQRADNRWVNLRLATRSQNLQNTGVRIDSAVGIKGVSWSKERHKWFAQITPPGQKRKSLGRYDCIAHAIKAYRRAAANYFGEFAP